MKTLALIWMFFLNTIWIPLIACPQVSGQYSCHAVDDLESLAQISIVQTKKNGVFELSVRYENAKPVTMSLDGKSREITILGEKAKIKAQCQGKQIRGDLTYVDSSTFYKLLVSPLDDGRFRGDLTSNSPWLPSNRYYCQKQ